jgi:hypothetical protein
MATPQKPVFFDGRQLCRVSPTNPIDTDVLEPDVVTTDGLHPFVANVAGAKATADAHLTTRLVVDRRIADGFWGGPVQAITNTPPVSPGAEQRWITGTLPTGAWSGNPNAFAAYRDGAWVFTPASEGVFVFNRATHSYVHYTGSVWAPILGTGTVTSVGLALPAEFAVTFSPVTGSGDLTAEWAVQAPGVVFAGPSDPLADHAVPGFRSLVETDIPFCALKGAVGSSGLTMAPARLLGRISDDPGAIEEISLGAGLSLSAGQLSCTVSAALPAGRVGFGGPDGILTGSIYLTYVSDGATGGLVISNTTPSTSSTTGGLVVAGGLGVGGSVYVGSDVSVGGTLIIKNVNEAVNTIGNTGAGTITVNCLTANRVTMTVTGNVTLAFTNVPSAGTAKTMVLHITNGAAFTFAFPANTRWSGGIAPVLRSSGLDIIGLTTIDGGNTWDGIPMSLDSKVP